MIDVPRSIEDAAERLRSGATKSVELTGQLLARADALDGELGAFLSRFDDAAMEAAARADDLFRAGADLGPLQGIPDWCEGHPRHP